MAQTKKSNPTKVESIRHKDKRANIPTEELRDFVVEEELAPKTMLYPRDPSLDPQLVWKGKDEQDREDLAVPVVPIYIQEKIHPQAIIDALPRIEKAGDNQINLFADFNGGPVEFDQKVDFYHHEQNWSNRLILGDSLLVMTSLAEKEGLKGKVQAIYFDPPYGIKFGSNWQVSTRKRDVKDGKAEDATRQPEQVRAFRDTWKLGIHSYLAYLRDRLVVARDLLTETGSVFVQIGDENVHLVRCLMDEVFGSENFCSSIAYKKTTGAGSPSGTTDLPPSVFDHLIWYAKSIKDVKYRRLYRERRAGEEGGTQYDWAERSDGGRRHLESLIDIQSDERLFTHDNLTSQSSGVTTTFAVSFEGKSIAPNKGGWKTNADGMTRLRFANRLMLLGNSLRYVRMHDDFPLSPRTNMWDDTVTSGFGDIKTYVVQSHPRVIERCLLMTTDPGDLVLDPTCGSGTTAYVAEQWGRRWITCDTSRVALALARTRLMAAKYPYYLLADSPEGIKKEAELTGTLTPALSQGARGNMEGDIRKGFVYKRVPHVTLKSIANNPDIKEGMTREQIDAAIARHAETETLFDQPYEDNKRVRVCGPFSVESLSPHRVLSTADDNQDGTVSEQEGRKQQDFATMILDNLRKAGVQNTRKSERLTFDRLDPYAGAWLHAAGEYTDADGKTRRVAVSIGPEHGTVGPQQVKEAAKEAVQGVGYDILAVCGFAFDPHVAEEVKRYGKLTVLPAKMNPDLTMGDELLKKTGAGNLFMVFGEPDVEIRKQKNGQIVAEIKGVDVYDPTTGQIRSGSTDDIACWFIDTDYNGESFFVRHAYFTGVEEPYDKLKRALRAEIDEAAWSSLYTTVSRPFAKPETGKIAVKVINHYGDEVLKVFHI
ncbi:site-specific DNA-methyltransferase [Candidatus Methylomirabilis sp.]|uniref:site-specific DNA-methyltransferase n=1 Tax=Candidatus Methylomirabilis sp. TaxID=2032687 RepID=UPI002A68311C|nr:site-specific DNA-methyltransferase [Candidatus Methylomirabilis sp.]